MKIKLYLLCFITMCTPFISVQAQDGIFSDAKTLASRQFSFGIQPIIFTQIDGDEFMLMFRGAYGVNSRLSLHGKVGLLREETYFGGHLEYLLADEPYEPLSFSVVGGAHSFGDIGLKLGGVLSKQISEFSLYSGLLFEPLFAEPEELYPLLLPIGIDIPVSGEQINFVFEVNLGLNDDAETYESVHFGLNFYF